jgi:hypothetical protein
MSMSISEAEILPRSTALADDPGLPERLQRIWETPRGLRGWISTVDH